MVKKKITKKIKLQIVGGKANPAPPVGPALGAEGVNIMGFCKEFNQRTQGQTGTVLPVEIDVFSDKSFSFVIKKPPVANLILSEIGQEKGSGKPNQDKVGKLSAEQVDKIIEIKRSDLRVASHEAARKLVEGTARSMGVDIVDEGGGS